MRKVNTARNVAVSYISGRFSIYLSIIYPVSHATGINPLTNFAGCKFISNVVSDKKITILKELICAFRCFLTYIKL